MLPNGCYISPIENWCAGAFLFGVNGFTVTKLTKDMLNKTCSDDDAHSCILICINNDEKDYVEPYLKKLGCRKSPQVNNWGHAGRKTYIYVYQIPKRIWGKRTGFDPNGEWALL